MPKYAYKKKVPQITKFDWSDVFENSDSDQSSNCGVPISVEPRKTLECHLEVTLTYPATTEWLNMPSILQKKKLYKIWDNMQILSLSPKFKHHIFEFHKSGHVHLHGVIAFEMENKFSQHGLVCDHVKLALMQYPKKYKNFSDNYFKSDFVRYRSPQICVQYINHQEKPKRYDEWLLYMQKCQ